MREPGYYWVTVTEPVCDGGGVIAETTGTPEIARWQDLRWYRMGMEGPVADQFDVHALLPEQRIPMPPDAHLGVELLRFAVAVDDQLENGDSRDTSGYLHWEKERLAAAMQAIHREYEARMATVLRGIQW